MAEPVAKVLEALAEAPTERKVPAVAAPAEAARLHDRLALPFGFGVVRVADCLVLGPRWTV